MKNFNKILLASILIIVGLIISSVETNAASTGSAMCSVTPAGGSIAQNGELGFVVSSNVSSSSSDYVYVSATNFSNGLYSDLGPGKIIPIGSTSLSFKVKARSDAETGNKTFKVYCAKGCPFGGCPGGGSSEVLDFATVSLNVTGTNPSGGDSGGTSTGSCSVPDISLPPNSSALIRFELPSLGSNFNNGSIKISGTSNTQGVTVTPSFPNLPIVNGRWNGIPEIVVKTGPSFTGGSYSATSTISGSNCTATGSITLPIVTNASGKLKLTAVKTLNPVLFPESGCVDANMYGTGSGGGCRLGFYAADFNSTGPRVMDYGNSQVLVGADLMRYSYSRVTPVSFNLTDPMNPTLLKSGVITYSEDSPKGEHGMTRALLSAISKDGKYNAVTTNYGVLAIQTPTKNKKILSSAFLEAGNYSLDIVKYNSNYILLYDNGAKNITNSDDIEAPLPDGFPDFNSYEFTGPKILSGDGSYIVVSASDPTGHIQPANNDILLFSINEPEPIAKLTMPVGHGKINFNLGLKIPFSGGDYVFTWGGTPGSGVNLFKFEYATKKITWVIKDASYSDYVSKYGRFFDAALTGFDAGNGNIGILAFNSTGAHAFLLSDIASGKWIDTLVSSPTPSLNQYGSNIAENGPIGSFSKNGITYVYSSHNAGQYVTVWKFEPNDGSNTGGPNTGGNPGGAPFYPTPPTTAEDPNCPGGTVYQTSAGALCVNSSGGVTTTTSYNFTPITTAAPYNKKTPTPPTYGLGDFILKKGSKGEAVKELQRLLNIKLNTSLIEDGKMGPATVAAVKKFQIENGLVSDGVVGSKTKGVLNAVVQ